MKTIVLFFILTTAINGNASAQSQEIQQLLLNIEKLTQLEKILSNMKEGYEILSAGYNTIEDLSKGNFDLHKTFLDALLQVSPEVSEYGKIATIVHYQIILLEEYNIAYARFSKDGNFSSEELAYLSRVYDNLFEQSLLDLENLTTIITANQLRMSDDERLLAIDKIYDDIQDKLLFLRQFNNNTTILAVQRAREQNDIDKIKTIYGLTH